MTFHFRGKSFAMRFCPLSFSRDFPNDEKSNTSCTILGFPEAAPAYKRKDLQVENPMMMAKSLPMNVPMPRMMLGRSPPDLDEDTSDIPKKIAELAKSLHVDTIGELPSPRLIE